MDFKKITLLLGILTLLAFIWMERYEVVPMMGHTNDGTMVTAYRLDRWTDRMSFLVDRNAVPVVEN